MTATNLAIEQMKFYKLFDILTGKFVGCQTWTHTCTSYVLQRLGNSEKDPSHINTHFLFGERWACFH